MAEEAPRDSTSKFKAAALAATAAAAMKSGRQDPEYLRVCQTKLIFHNFKRYFLSK